MRKHCLDLQKQKKKLTDLLVYTALLYSSFLRWQGRLLIKWMCCLLKAICTAISVSERDHRFWGEQWRAPFPEVPAGQLYSLHMTAIHRECILRSRTVTHEWFDFPTINILYS